MSKTNIQWTEQTWNPIIGCSKVSAGCKNCYAIPMSHRLAHIPTTSEKYAGITEKNANGTINFTGVTKIDEKALLAPLKRKKPTMYFVNSMSDMFHENVPFEWIDKIMAVIALCPQHTFQVLTKRADRMKEYFDGYLKRNGFANSLRDILLKNNYSEIQIIELVLKIDDFLNKKPLPNLWLGVSVENQEQADKRIPYLLETPAKVRFLSCEPLLEQVYLPSLPKIDWVIVGGESGGKGTRPMHPDWVRNIRNQCEATGTKFFFKQWGDWLPVRSEGIYHHERIDFTDGTAMINVGKHKAGRLLDGIAYNEMPETKNPTTKK